MKFSVKNKTARGAIGGVAARFATRIVGPEYGPAAGTILAGYAMKDDFLQEFGGYQLGASLGGRLPFVGNDALAEGGNLPAGGWL